MQWKRGVGQSGWFFTKFVTAFGDKLVTIFVTKFGDKLDDQIAKFSEKFGDKFCESSNLVMNLSPQNGEKLITKLVTNFGDKSGDQFAKYGEKFGESSNGVTTLSLDLVTN